MKEFLSYFIPIVIMISAVYLILQEIRGLIRMRKFDPETKIPYVRLFRRLSGAFLLIVIAVMIFFGSRHAITDKIANRNELYWESQFWVICLVIVLVVIVLALWDAIEGLSRIRKLLEKDIKESDIFKKPRFKN